MRHSIGHEARLCAWVECGTVLVFEQIISAPDPTQLGEACAQDICADQIFLYSDRYQLGQVSVLIDHGVIKPHIDRCFSLEKMPTSILIVNGGMVGGNLL